jgi:deoxyribose-phosphate aldolase
VSEALGAAKDGAHELDAVLNRGVLKDGLYSAVFAELHAIREACPKSELKLIFETSELSTDEVLKACVLAYEARWEYVKTSTGFCGRGASLEDVELMSNVATIMQKKGKGVGRSPTKVKASGGVRSWKDAVEMVQKGASRIGTSRGVGITVEEKQHSGKD